MFSPQRGNKAKIAHSVRDRGEKLDPVHPQASATELAAFTQLGKACGTAQNAACLFWRANPRLVEFLGLSRWASREHKELMEVCRRGLKPHTAVSATIRSGLGLKRRHTYAKGENVRQCLWQ